MATFDDMKDAVAFYDAAPDDVEVYLVDTVDRLVLVDGKPWLPLNAVFSDKAIA